MRGAWTCSLVAALCCGLGLATSASAQAQEPALPVAPLGPGCEVDEACPPDLVCVEGKCSNVCEGKPCGSNALCEVRDHRPVCVCADSHYGDPVEGCVKQEPECKQDEECGAGKACSGGSCVPKECVGKVCGLHAVCVAPGGVPACQCPLGYAGDGVTDCVKPPVLVSMAEGEKQGDAGKKDDSQCRGNRFPKPAGKKVYLVVTNIKANWWNAYMHCVTHGHRMAVVENEEENNQILEAIKNSEVHNGNFFISGNDRGTEDRWFWMTTGLPITKFTYWHAYRPVFNVNLDCMSYKETDFPTGRVGYRWFDSLCTEKHNFICEDFVN